MNHTSRKSVKKLLHWIDLKQGENPMKKFKAEGPEGPNSKMPSMG